MLSFMDDLAGSIGAGGFEGLDLGKAKDAAQKQLKAMAHEDKIRAMRIAKWFETTDGREALQWIIRCSILRSWSDVEIAPPSIELYALEKAKRQGQSSIAIMIIGMILTARDERAEQQEAKA